MLQQRGRRREKSCQAEGDISEKKSSDCYSELERRCYTDFYSLRFRFTCGYESVTGGKTQFDLRAWESTQRMKKM